jgi:hypothetical protein
VQAEEVNRQFQESIAEIKAELEKIQVRYLQHNFTVPFRMYNSQERQLESQTIEACDERRQ